MRVCSVKTGSLQQMPDQRTYVVELSTPRGRQQVEVLALTAMEARRLAVGPRQKGSPVAVSVKLKREPEVRERPARQRGDRALAAVKAGQWLAALLEETGLSRAELAALARERSRR